MKKISTSKNLTKDSEENEFANVSGCEEMQMVEIEQEEIGCQGCNHGFIVTGMDLTQDFIWHPKRKY